MTARLGMSNISASSWPHCQPDDRGDIRRCQTGRHSLMDGLRAGRAKDFQKSAREAGDRPAQL